MSDIQELIHRSSMLAYEQGSKDVLARIVKVIEQERDSWTRQATFSYKNALTELIRKIEAMR